MRFTDGTLSEIFQIFKSDFPIEERLTLGSHGSTWANLPAKWLHIESGKFAFTWYFFLHLLTSSYSSWLVRRKAEMT